MLNNSNPDKNIAQSNVSSNSLPASSNKEYGIYVKFLISDFFVTEEVIPEKCKVYRKGKITHYNLEGIDSVNLVISELFKKKYQKEEPAKNDINKLKKCMYALYNLLEYKTFPNVDAEVYLHKTAILGGLGALFTAINKHPYYYNLINNQFINFFRNRIYHLSCIFNRYSLDNLLSISTHLYHHCLLELAPVWKFPVLILPLEKNDAFQVSFKKLIVDCYGTHSLFYEYNDAVKQELENTYLSYQSILKLSNTLLETYTTNNLPLRELKAVIGNSLGLHIARLSGGARALINQKTWDDKLDEKIVIRLSVEDKDKIRAKYGNFIKLGNQFRHNELMYDELINKLLSNAKNKFSKKKHKKKQKPSSLISTTSLHQPENESSMLSYPAPNLISHLSISESENLSVQDKLKKYSCHYNWAYDKKQFIDRQERNIKTCNLHIHDSPDPVVYNFFGFLLSKVGRYYQAESCFKEALKLFEDEPVALANLANFYFERGRNQEALELIEKLDKIENLSSNGWLHWENAYFYMRLFDYDKAIDSYEHAKAYTHTLPPEYAYRIFLYQGIALNRQVNLLKKSKSSLENNELIPSKINRSIKTLKEALALNRKNYLIHCHLGVAYSHISFKDESNFMIAADYFRQSLNLKPEDPNTLRFFGKLFLNKQCYNKALDLFNTSIKQEATSAAYHNRGMIYFRMKKWDEGQKDLLQAIKLDAHNTAAMFDLIYIYQQQGKFGLALNWCQELKDRLPASCLHVTLNMRWAEILEAIGNYALAVVKYEEALYGEDLDKHEQENARRFIVTYYQHCWEKSKMVSDLIIYIKTLIKYFSPVVVLKFLNEQKENYRECFFLHYQIGILQLANNQFDTAVENLIYAYSLANTPKDQSLCFAIIRDVYLGIASRFEKNMLTSNIDFLEEQFNKFNAQISGIWKTYADLENCLHSQDRLHWSKNLSIFYGSKKAHKIIQFSGDEIHRSLKEEIKQHYLTYFKTKKTPKNINFANAKISFIVSDYSNQSLGMPNRKFISIPLTVTKEAHIKHVKHYYDFYKFFIGKNQYVPRSKELLQDVLATSSLSKYEGIIKSYLNKNSANGFHRDYHCSERAFYGFLMRWIGTILDEIEIQMGYQKGIKIYAIIIDLYTDRYLCEKCEQSTYYAYSPDGKFISSLVEAILARGHYVQTKSKTIDVAVRVSAERPAKGQAKQTQANHTEEVLELKGAATKQGVLLLQRDNSINEIPSDSSQLIFTNQKKNCK